MTRRRSFVLLFAAFAIAGCDSADSSGGDVNEFFPAPDPSEGFQVGMTTVAPAGEEIWKCLVLDGLPTEERFSFINRGEHKQTPFVHHMDLMALGFTGLNFEPGIHDCEDLYQGDAAETLMDEGIILYASQQAEDVVQLPEGVVAEVPSPTEFMFEVHYVNTTDEDVEVQSWVNAYTIPADEITGNIWGGPVRDRNINVPPGAEDHVEWTRCVMTEDVELIFMSSHTHELARTFQVRPFDGQVVQDEMLYENRDWQSPFLQHFDPPLKVKKGEGFEFQCHYASTRDSETHWGFTAQDEMCQIGIVYTPGDSGIDCEVVETSDGVIAP